MKQDTMVTAPSKVCTKCGEEKPATREHFHVNGMGRFGFVSWCRICCAERNRERRAADPEQHRARARARYVADPERHRAYAAKHRAAHREQVNAGLRQWQTSERGQDVKLTYRFGIDAFDRVVLLRLQGGACAIPGCGVCETEEGPLHVDHIELPNGERIVRGLLCRDHNTSLGKFGDDAAGLLVAAAYVAEHDPHATDEVRRLVADARELVDEQARIDREAASIARRVLPLLPMAPAAMALAA